MKTSKLFVLSIITIVSIFLGSCTSVTTVKVAGMSMQFGITDLSGVKVINPYSNLRMCVVDDRNPALKYWQDANGETFVPSGILIRNEHMPLTANFYEAGNPVSIGYATYKFHSRSRSTLESSHATWEPNPRWKRTYASESRRMRW
ncbi:MAG: hypothetical protein WC767_01945 [Candidatus Paceibacterota bacterium]|jgi:hypothetical protein